MRKIRTRIDRKACSGDRNSWACRGETLKQGACGGALTNLNVPSALLNCLTKSQRDVAANSYVSSVIRWGKPWDNRGGCIKRGGSIDVRERPLARQNRCPRRIEEFNANILILYLAVGDRCKSQGTESVREREAPGEGLENVVLCYSTDSIGKRFWTS